MGMMKVLNIWLDGSATQHYFLCLKVIILTWLQAWPYAVNLENVVAITYVQVAFPRVFGQDSFAPFWLNCLRERTENERRDRKV